MSQLRLQFSALAICTLLTIIICPAAKCEETGSSSINVKRVADGLVVIVNSSLKNLDDVLFSCDQERNEIVVTLPASDETSPTESLKNNPNISRSGITTKMLSPEIAQIRLSPKLKLRCGGIKMVSRFQRYITYLYPAGRDLSIVSAELKGFDFDENRPRTQTTGSLLLTFSEPLGSLDIAEIVSTADNRLEFNLNPRDFVHQAVFPSLPSPSGLTVRSSFADPSAPQSLIFQGVHDAIVSRVKAKPVKSAESEQLRIDLTLTLSLYETGKKLYQNGDLRKALLYLDAAKGEPTTSLVARMSMGTIFWNEDNYQDAARAFRELIDLDRNWEFPDARYYLAKSLYLINNRLSFELTAQLKEYLRRCDRMKYSACSEARELSEQVSEPTLKLNQASKPELKKLLARLADPRLNPSEVQKNIFHYWATWCPLCLEEIPKIMKYAVAHPNINIYIIAKHDTPKAILSTLLKSGAIRRSNIFYFIDTKDDIMLRQAVPLILASKEPMTPLPISVFMQRELPFYITDRLDWNEPELSKIWKLKYQE